MLKREELPLALSPTPSGNPGLAPIHGDSPGAREVGEGQGQRQQPSLCTKQNKIKHLKFPQNYIRIINHPQDT